MQAAILISIVSVVLILLLKLSEINSKIDRVQKNLDRHDEVMTSAFKSVFEETPEEAEFLEKIKQILKKEG